MTQDHQLTVGALAEAVNAKEGVVLLDLTGLDLGQGVDGGQATVLCQG